MQLRRHIPELREMQLKSSVQSLLLLQAGVQMPPGKLPPVMQRLSAQSAFALQDSPVAALSSLAQADANTSESAT